MTVIVAELDRAKGWASMASDSRQEGPFVVDAGPKFIRWSGDHLVGCAGAAFGWSWLLRAMKRGELPDLPTPDLEAFGSAWRAFCEERGHVETHHGIRSYPSTFLVVGKSGLFELEDSGEFIEHRGSAAAIGCGAVAGMASLLTLRDQGFEGRRSVETAARIASRLVPGCGVPIHAETVSWVPRC